MLGECIRALPETEAKTSTSTAELVPVKHRGTYLAAVTFFVLPFVPYVMYSQLLGTYHTWRWGIYICIIYNGVFFIGAALTYFPKSHTRAAGVRKRDILKRIDYGGGFFSVVGVTLLLVALQSGGYDHPWSSAYVLCTLLIGILLIFTFIVSPPLLLISPKFFFYQTVFLVLR